MYTPPRKGGPPRREFTYLHVPANVIALDGVAGAGKGTAARKVAEELGYNLLDSGALYRVVALRAIQTQTSLIDVSDLVVLAKAFSASFLYDGRILVGRKSIAPFLKRPDVEDLTPKIGAIPEVREALREVQFRRRVPPGLVTDGRDQCQLFSSTSDEHRRRTFGFFVTAEPEVRADRIVRRMREAGETNIDKDRVLADLIERDEKDRTRLVSPLVQHPDAELIDTTQVNAEEVSAYILGRYRALCKIRQL